MLAGLTAGAVTASTALRPPAAGDGIGAHVAMAAPSLVAVTSPAPAPAEAAPVRTPEPLAVLRDESALAELDYRRGLAAQVARSTPTPGSLVRPARGAMTGWFGEGRTTHRHVGIDYDGNTGDPVVAAGGGTVTHAGPAPSGYSGYGQMVLIDHGAGVVTLYAHLSRITVGRGASVRAGDAVGAIGTTGNVTGSHLHFEVRVGGRPVNPAPWVAR